MTRAGVRTAAALALAGAVAAYDFTATRKTGALTDQARVVRDPAAAARIRREVETLGKSGGPKVAVLTLSNLESEPADDVANAIRRAWGDDVLVMLAVAERRASIDARAGLSIDRTAVLDRMSPALSRGDHGAALLEAVRAIGGAPAGSAPVPLRYFAWLAPVSVLGWLYLRKPPAERSWTRANAFRCESGPGGFGGAER